MSAPPSPRKGARTMAEIPPAVRRRLDAGLEETRTLVEWLAVDAGRLAAAVLPAAGLDDPAPLAQARRLAKAPAGQRGKGMGRAIHAALAPRPAADRRRILAALGAHASDVVRAWAAYAVGADPSLPLARRLRALRPFAADPNMGTRECAWDAWRPHVAGALEEGLALLRPWVLDADPRIRRCAVEGTRPRGVWTAHVPALVADPELGLPLLEPVRSDPSDYVRRAVANWINDASKSQPAWARAVTARWRRESPTPETAWIVARGLRTIEPPVRTLRGGRPRPDARQRRGPASGSR